MAWHFHTGVSDTLAHVQALLAKRSSADDLWVVQGPKELLDVLDAQLWTQVAGSFLPHLTWSASTAWTSLVQRTRLWLMPTGLVWPEQAADAKLLINLEAADMPAPVDVKGPGDEHQEPGVASPCWRAQHGVVVVGQGREQVACGRQLWKLAQGLGLNPQHRDSTGAAS